MDRTTIIDTLKEARKIAYTLWGEYHQKARESDIWADVRDYYELRIRALDYAMEALRHDTV